MLDYTLSLGAWVWFVLGITLFTLEIVVPGIHLLWFGLAAVLVGILALSVELSWQWQVISFAITSTLSVFLVRRYARYEMRASDQPDLNERSQQYVGRVVVVEEAIANGRGRVRVSDTVWAAEGPDTPAGASVKVMAARGPILMVEPVRPG